jgi:hypothetical protein
MCNVGFFDRFLRVFVGSILFFVGLFAGNIILLIIGAIPLATGFMGLCPVYSLFGIDTGCENEAG